MELHKFYESSKLHKKCSIKIGKNPLDLLKTARDFPRQSYNDVILKILKIHLRNRADNQKDEFIQEFQQSMMRELWEDAENNAWATSHD